MIMMAAVYLLPSAPFGPERQEDPKEPLITQQELDNDIDQITQKEEEIAPELADLSVTNTHWGNVFWGRYINDWSNQSDFAVAYPFSGLDTIERGQNENWIAHLECPITEEIIDSATMDSLLKFSCLPEYLDEAAKHFEAFSLANNHTDNMNEVDGFELTKSYLEDVGIDYYGHYDNTLDEACKVIWFDSTLDEISMPIAYCGYHYLYRLPTDEELSLVSKYSEFLPVVAVVQMGVEYEVVPDGLQTEVYRKLIDNGADAVISDHPHVVQTAEVYKDKLIFYSTGNFIFDQQFSWDVTRSAGVVAEFAFKEVDLDVLKSLKLVCGVADCLGAMKDNNWVKPEYRLSYDLKVSDSSNKLTKKASEEDYQRIYDRVNWGEVISELN